MRTAPDTNGPVGNGSVVRAYLALCTVAAILATNYVAMELATEFIGSSAGGESFYGVGGLLTWVALQVTTFGCLGAGGTVLYRRWTGRDLSLGTPADLVGRTVASVAALVVAAVAVGATVEVPVSTVSGLFGQTAAVRGPANPTPDAVVASFVVATRLFVVAPAFGLVIHGIFQTSLADDVGRTVGIVSSGVVAMAALLPLLPGGVQGTGLAALFYAGAVLFALAATVGYWYDSTKSLLIPIVGYSSFLAVTALAGVLF